MFGHYVGLCGHVWVSRTNMGKKDEKNNYKLNLMIMSPFSGTKNIVFSTNSYLQWIQHSQIDKKITCFIQNLEDFHFFHAFNPYGKT